MELPKANFILLPSSFTLSTRHYPFGGQRWSSGSALSDFDFTGQRLDGFGLLDYKARYYDSVIGRFVSADTVVPDYKNPQDLNRFSYVRNNPLRYVDPSGHYLFEDEPDDPWTYHHNLGTSEVILAAEPVAHPEEMRRVTGWDFVRPVAVLYGSAVMFSVAIPAAGETVWTAIGEPIAKGIQAWNMVRTAKYTGAAAKAAKIAQEKGITIQPKLLKSGVIGETNGPDRFFIDSFQVGYRAGIKSIEEMIARTIIHECTHCVDLRTLGQQSVQGIQQANLLEFRAYLAEELWARSQGFAPMYEIGQLYERFFQ